MHQLGDLQFHVVSGGPFFLDGGAMFGIIPRPLWTRLYAPDDRGRIRLDTNCLLVRTGRECLLIDTGNGPKMDEKERSIFGLAPGAPLLTNLAELGVSPADVTMVLFSHLHMDHCGGASHWDADRLVPTFPNARFVAQRREWEDALTNRSHMRTSYRRENLNPLAVSGRLELLDGDAAIAPGVSVQVTGGHTPGHQVVLLRGGGRTAVFLGDICPTPAHFRPPCNMAYDMDPYATMLAKAELLARAADEDWLVLFDHEPDRKAVRIRRDGEEFVALPVE